MSLVAFLFRSRSSFSSCAPKSCFSCVVTLPPPILPVCVCIPFPVAPSVRKRHIYFSWFFSPNRRYITLFGRTCFLPFQDGGRRRHFRFSDFVGRPWLWIDPLQSLFFHSTARDRKAATALPWTGFEVAFEQSKTRYTSSGATSGIKTLEFYEFG